MSANIRLATAIDAGSISTIYNQGIEDRVATFETAASTPEKIATQLATKGNVFPTIVVESDAQIVAFATAGPYRERECYAGIAEHSVYVDRSFRGHGFGRQALDALCEVYADRQYWKLVSRIFADNTPSIRLHEGCGFRIVGTYQRHARLDGAWKDCVIVERLLP